MFRRVIFPSLKPINVVVAVITVIEALRAFDIVFALNSPRGTEVMGRCHQHLVGEGGGHVGTGSAYGMVLFVLCIGFIIWYVANNFREAHVSGTSWPRDVAASVARATISRATGCGSASPPWPPAVAHPAVRVR